MMTRTQIDQLATVYAVREAQQDGKQIWLRMGPTWFAMHYGWQAADAFCSAYVDANVRQRCKAGQYWRGTNRRAEYADLKRGVAIRSRNHADSTAECGMSVAETPAYIATQGYCYGYRVRGIVVGHGSDGEPLLVDARPVGKLLKREQILAEDRPRIMARRAAECIIAMSTGLSWDEVGRLACGC